MFRQYLYAVSLLYVLLVAPAQARQTLRWMGHWKGEGLREQLVREVQEDFSFLNQDIDLQLTFAADLLPEKTQKAGAEFIANMIRSGEITQDVVWLDTTIYREVGSLLQNPNWGKKYLVDFFTVPGVKEAHKPFLFKKRDCCFRTGDLLTGPYIEGFFYALFYNHTTAEKLGISVPEEEMTFNDLLSAAQQVQKYNRTADSPISFFTDFKASAAAQRLAYNLFLSLPQDPVAEEPDAVLRKILEAFEQLGNCISFSEETIRKDRRAAAAELAAGRALFLVDATWFYNSFQSGFPDEIQALRPVQMPGFGRQEFYVGGFIPTWAVMKNSPAREAGIRLLQFWSQPDIAEKWVRYTKSPTALAGNVYDPSYGQDAFAEFQNRLTEDRRLKPDIFTVPVDAGPIRKTFPFLYPLLQRKITADEAFKQIESTL